MREHSGHGIEAVHDLRTGRCPLGVEQVLEGEPVEKGDEDRGGGAGVVVAAERDRRAQVVVGAGQAGAQGVVRQ
ncbi:MAG: hypothetical protein M3459_13525 [Actinomycetota bacterium]|nr:hypothetical protein [Actinomycetota bacterium]